MKNHHFISSRHPHPEELLNKVRKAREEGYTYLQIIKMYPVNSHIISAVVHGKTPYHIERYFFTKERALKEINDFPFDSLSQRMKRHPIKFQVISRKFKEYNIRWKWSELNGKRTKKWICYE